MTPTDRGGRHARKSGHSRKRAHQIRSAVLGFAVVAICVAAVAIVALRHDDSGPVAASPTSHTATTLAGWVPTSASHSSTTTAGDSSATTGASPSTVPASAPSTSSRAAAAAAAGSASLNGKVVVIDPGHNGGNSANPSEMNRQVPMGGGQTKACDTSGTETDDGYPEHAFTFDVSTRLAAALRSKGATVYLTRDNDTGVGPCVDVRAASGGDHHANVAISIHGDGGPADGRGFHVLEPAGCSGCDDQIVAPSAKFATILRDTFRAQTPMPTSTYLGTDGIMPRTDLAGINLSTVPKVFIECGNMRNATDATLMKTATYRQQAADAIANGIALYLGSS